MNIPELENLAKAATPDTQWNRHMLGNQGETILAMIELLREMGEALENLEQVKGRHHTEQAYNKCMDALERYKEMTK